MNYIVFYPSTDSNSNIEKMIEKSTAKQILVSLIAEFNYCNLKIFEVNEGGVEEFVKVFNDGNIEYDYYKSVAISMDADEFYDIAVNHKRDFVVLADGKIPATYANGGYLDVHSVRYSAENERCENDIVVCLMSLWHKNTHSYEVHLFENDDYYNEVACFPYVDDDNWDKQTKGFLMQFYSERENSENARKNAHRSLCSSLTDEEYDAMMELINTHEFHDYSRMESSIKNADLRVMVDAVYEEARYVIYEVIKKYGCDKIFEDYKYVIKYEGYDFLLGDAYWVAECAEELKNKYSELFN